MMLPAFPPADEPGDNRLEPDAFWQSVDSQFAAQLGGPSVDESRTLFTSTSTPQEDTLDPVCASCPSLSLSPIVLGADLRLLRLQMTPSSWHTSAPSTSLYEMRS